MKKFFLPLLLSLCTLFSAVAQTSNQPLTFKGIPVEGSVNSFCEKLIAKGAEWIGREGNACMLTGKFAGENDCDFVIKGTEKTDEIIFVMAQLPKQNNWYSLELQYRTFIKLLTTKYGEPTKTIEEFKGGTPTDVFQKYQQVLDDECIYLTAFTVNQNIISVSLSHTDSDARVFISYINLKNFQADQSKAINDL